MAARVVLTRAHVDENNIVEPSLQILRRDHVTWIGVTLAGHGAPFVRDVVRTGANRVNRLCEKRSNTQVREGARGGMLP